ncbi:hypothetical protein [Lentzea cavernae]|uniref:Lipoprotein n=1 Tax=Lentzea cavernae TaxID=2020703 RepID=A0ABQ3MAK4_9PSEU|nr:hypothetical protein [Lentzea cavernae]GHH36589.1 hypothetical protein GCM10017774_23680 [Lentzea cavernae]
MRKLAVVLLSCLALTACGSTWQADVRYKIVAVDESNSPTVYFKLEPVDEAPQGTLEPEQLKRQLLQTNLIEGGQVGDEVLCAVEQEKGSAFGNSNVVTHLRNCKKA